MNANVNPAAIGTLPSGDIDFNKPIQTEAGLVARVVGQLTGNEFPVVVAITYLDGKEGIGLFNTDGEEDCGGHILINKPEAPSVLYGRLLKDETGQFYLDEEPYTSEAAAKDRGSYELVAIFPIVVPVPGQGAVASDLPAATVNGIDFSVGDRVETFRSGIGRRVGTVLKIRDSQKSALFVQHDDGSNPYWALSRSIRKNLGRATPAVEAAPVAEEALDSITLANGTFRVGDQVFFDSRRRGDGYATVKKIRTDNKRSLYIQPEDGATPFWALNRNVETV